MYAKNMVYVWQKKIWPHFKWEIKPLMAVLGRVRVAQGKLISKAHSLGFDLSREAQAKVLSEETVKTAAIEGETLNPVLVRSSVAKRLGLSTVGLPPVERRVDGLVEVLLDATLNYNKPLTLNRLKGWHAALFPTGYSGMRQIPVGRWRKLDPMQVVSGPIGREKVHFEAPPSDRLDQEMHRFLDWWQKTLYNPNEEGVLRAGAIHFYFVTIHPFEDGNGRMARALTDMALAQDEKMPVRLYSLSSQIMVERNAYYKALEKAQRGNGDITEWLFWFVSCLERALNHSELLIETTVAKAHFWQKCASFNLNERQRKVLNRLLDAGKDSFKGGLTTRKYVSLARVSRATAYREINDLVLQRILIPNKASGRSTSYQLNPKF